MRCRVKSLLKLETNINHKAPHKKSNEKIVWSISVAPAYFQLFRVYRICNAIGISIRIRPAGRVDFFRRTAGFRPFRQERI